MKKSLIKNLTIEDIECVEEVEIPVGEYKATQEEFSIKQVDGKLVVNLSSKIIDGKFTSKVITTTHWLYKYGTTEYDNRALTTVCLFLANIYGLDIRTAHEKLEDLIWDAKYEKPEVKLKKDVDFPDDVPEGTLKSSDFKWVRDGVEHTKRYYNFYGDTAKWKERMANNPEARKCVERTYPLRDKIVQDHHDIQFGITSCHDEGSIRPEDTHVFESDGVDPWMIDTDMF